MRAEIRVSIIEEDPFALNWMAMLLARDWRTRIINESETVCQLLKSLKNDLEHTDLILVDADLINSRIIQKFQNTLKNWGNTKILVTGNLASQNVWKYISRVPLISGYILKSEINYSLAWAVDLATEGYWVVTPGVQFLANKLAMVLPQNSLVLDGRRTINNLTDHEIKVARMALIFSMERRELSDELGVSNDWGYGLVSALYKKLGLEEVLSGEVEPSSYLGTHPTVLERVQFITNELQLSKKAKDLETLAFHMITMPEISR